MRDFPSCFGENGVQISDTATTTTTPPPPPPTTAAKTAQNLVTCTYHCNLHNSSSFIITITWSKTLIGHHLSAQINNPINQSLCKLQIKPTLFSKSKGYRNFQVGPTQIHFFYDLSIAKFTTSPEPIRDFYFAIAINQELILQLGDMEKQLIKKLNTNRFNFTSFPPNSILISKKEHIFGKKSYSTTAQFNGKGQIHEISIECDTINTIDPSLVVRIDGKSVMQVKRLRWKFRGNYTILVDGLPVEVYWDVYDWFNDNNGGKLIGGNGVFLFQTCLSAEKLWGSAISWSNSLVKEKESMGLGLGFCLVLCVWKDE
ncbi:hypothetical protein OSB04_022962 [Centaurea solstitialis]|uniref:Uncharacterized protein n=1 Tax=Centaurea solstitialis TaxID=347529 RepID=A0AA38SI90_9ASTR|nr:hypothetical protein OSB04_022962 [Centaurea solstitialis]